MVFAVEDESVRRSGDLGQAIFGDFGLSVVRRSGRIGRLQSLVSGFVLQRSYEGRGWRRQETNDSCCRIVEDRDMGSDECATVF